MHRRRAGARASTSACWPRPASRSIRDLHPRGGGRPARRDRPRHQARRRARRRLSRVASESPHFEGGSHGVAGTQAGQQGARDHPGRLRRVGGGAATGRSAGGPRTTRTRSRRSSGLDAGVNWIDTAAVYGLGHSEEVVARALEGVPPDRPLRLHQVRHGLGRGPPTACRASNLRPELDPPRVRGLAPPPRRGARSTSTSSTGPTRPGRRVEDSWAVMARPRRRGQGALAGRLQLRRRAARALRADPPRGLLQPPFSPIQRDVAAAEIPWCAEQRHRRHRVQPDA